MSAALEKAHKVGQGEKVQLPASGKLKTHVLKAAGISVSEANRCEQLAKVKPATVKNGELLDSNSSIGKDGKTRPRQYRYVDDSPVEAKKSPTGNP